MTAQSLLHIGHCEEKNCVDRVNEKFVAMATSTQQSQPCFTAIIYDHNATNFENFAKIRRVLSEITGLESIVKTGSSFGS